MHGAYSPPPCYPRPPLAPSPDPTLARPCLPAPRHLLWPNARWPALSEQPTARSPRVFERRLRLVRKITKINHFPRKPNKAMCAVSSTMGDATYLTKGDNSRKYHNVFTADEAIQGGGGDEKGGRTSCPRLWDLSPSDRRMLNLSARELSFPRSLSSRNLAGHAYKLFSTSPTRFVPSCTFPTNFANYDIKFCADIGSDNRTKIASAQFGVEVIGGGGDKRGYMDFRYYCSYSRDLWSRISQDRRQISKNCRRTLVDIDKLPVCANVQFETPEYGGELPRKHKTPVTCWQFHFNKPAIIWRELDCSGRTNQGFKSSHADEFISFATSS